MEANYLVLYTNEKRASFSSKTQYHKVAKYIFFLSSKGFARKNMNSTNKKLSLLLFVLGTISAGKSQTFFYILFNMQYNCQINDTLLCIFSGMLDSYMLKFRSFKAQDLNFTRFIMWAFLSICTWFLTFSSLKYRAWWTDFFPILNWIFLPAACSL